MNENKSEGDNLVQILWDLIKLENYENALNEIRKAVHSKYLYENSLEIIPMLIAVSDENFFNSKAEKCLEELLIEIALHANCKESTIGFLEQMEKYNSISVFCILLKPLGYILNNTNASKGKVYSWIFEIIYEQIRNFPLPTDYILDKDEKAIPPCEYDIFEYKKKLADMLIKLIDFYHNVYPFTDVNKTTTILIGTDISHYLLLLFERPLVYLEIDKNNKFYNLSLKLIIMMNKATCNILFFIKYIKPFSVASIDKVVEEKKGEKLSSQLAISSFLYCIMCLHMECYLIPQIYNPLYLYYSCVPSCIYLLKEEKQIPQFKGIQLTTHFFNLLPNESLTLESYEVPNLLNLSRMLINITLYSENERLRKRAITTFKLYCKKFNIPARLCLVQHILEFYKHTGIHSVVIHEFKEILVHKYKNKECNFNDKDLFNTLICCCILSERETTDILECSDRIISALNLLIFLSIRDQHNICGWKMCLPIINEEFINPLTTGLRLSKGHYKLRLKQLIEEKLVKGSDTVQKLQNNEVIPDHISDQEVNVMHSALNCFDLISSLVARLQYFLA